jgi:hypothetical protein
MRSCIISRICICFIILCAFHFSFGCLSISKAFLKFTKQRDFCEKFKYGFNFSNLSFWQKGKAKQKRKKEKKRKEKTAKGQGETFPAQTHHLAPAQHHADPEGVRFLSSRSR